ncbi:MAG TPA: recombination protein RecR, partial [Candidatus Parcubacteria bacterium]|nr:recombination protein RecR [Candidatus Parcubacteria bacterium]
MYPFPIQKLIDLFSKFPTIGQRTATRFVFYLLRLSPKEINEFLNSVVELRKKIKTCAFCFNPFEIENGSQNESLCPICRNKTRDQTTLCIVEKEIDLISIEKTKKYKGVYFI